MLMDAIVKLANSQFFFLFFPFVPTKMLFHQIPIALKLIWANFCFHDETWWMQAYKKEWDCNDFGGQLSFLEH